MTAGSLAGAALWRRVRSRLDWPLVLTTFAIAAIGLLNLYSATRYAPQRGLFGQQCGWMLIGLLAFTAATLIDYHVWRRTAWILLLLGVIAVVGVHFVGIAVKGSRRWLGVGGMRVQPSEFVKLGVIVALARFVHDRGAAEMAPLGIAARVLIFLATVCVIAWQPDLGTASLVALICLSVAFMAAKRLWPLLAGLASLGAAIPLLWAYYFHDYQKKRILTFMDPSADPSGAGWHARQSIFAIGSGRWSGKGFMRGTQNQLNFLPEYWTDFPFSVWAEEWGFVGAIVLLGLYVFLVLWILNVASQARDRFGATVCLGVAAMIFWHVLVNIAMVTGLAPVVGVTLPLISYGGSSVLTIMVGLGLVASVSMRRWAR